MTNNNEIKINHSSFFSSICFGVIFGMAFIMIVNSIVPRGTSIFNFGSSQKRYNKIFIYCKEAPPMSVTGKIREHQITTCINSLSEDSNIFKK